MWENSNSAYKRQIYPLPSHLHYHMQIQDIVAKANTSITNHCLENMTLEQEHSLSLAVNSYDVQLRTLIEGQLSSTGKLTPPQNRKAANSFGY